MNATSHTEGYAENKPIHSIMLPTEVYVPKTDAGDEPSSRNSVHHLHSRTEGAATRQTANAYVRRMSTRHLCTALSLARSLARSLWNEVISGGKGIDAQVTSGASGCAGAGACAKRGGGSRNGYLDLKIPVCLVIFVVAKRLV